jgi:Double zinc ribbon
MDIFDEARKAFKQAADGISRGAEGLRLDADIADLQKLVSENYAAVGRRAAQLAKLGRVSDAELQSLLGVAEKAEAKLQAAQEVAQAMRRGERVRRCPGCGEPVLKLTEFCEKCGRKLPVCKQCLEPLSGEDTACPACGTAVEVEGAGPPPPAGGAPTG